MEEIKEGRKTQRPVGKMRRENKGKEGGRKGGRFGEREKERMGVRMES